MNDRDTQADTPTREAQNTDTHLWRRSNSYYSPSVHATIEGGIGMNVGGHVIVAPVEKWHAAMRAALAAPTREPEPEGIVDLMERKLAGEDVGTKLHDMIEAAAENYVAWMRMTDRGRYVLCDSDAEGAFKVYREHVLRAALAARPVDPAEPTQELWKLAADIGTKVDDIVKFCQPSAVAEQRWKAFQPWLDSEIAKLATPAEPSKITRVSDGWYSLDEGLSWHHPAPNAAAPLFGNSLTVKVGVATPAEPSVRAAMEERHD